MKTLLALASLLLIAATVCATDLDRSRFNLIDDRPKAAVEEGPAKGSVSVPQPTKPATSSKVDIFNALLEKAKVDQKDLIVWVGVRCLPCEKKLSHCYHGHLDAFNGDSSPRVIVGRYRNGDVFGDREFPGLPSVEQIQAALGGAEQGYHTPKKDYSREGWTFDPTTGYWWRYSQPQYQATQIYQYQNQPQYQFQQPFQGYRGGFGGGFGGGGSCAGGSCSGGG